MKLVERRKEVVRELDLWEGGVALCTHSDSKADDSLLSQRCIKDSLTAESFSKSHGAAEDAAECDIFAEYAGLFVGF